MLRNIDILIPVVSIAVLVAGCRTNDSGPLGLSGSRASGPIDKPAGGEVPAYPGAGGFVAAIDNPFLGFAPGRTFTYEGDTEAGHERIVVEVTRQKKDILGVGCTVVHDRRYVDGLLTEDTFDWLAQDADGNVWYFGEDSRTLDANGTVVSTEGSWEAGVAGATPGVAMLAEPERGDTYQQEFAEGVAEDMARIVGLAADVEVPYGSFGDCLQVLEWTPLEPGAREYKYYARGVGQVLETSARGGQEPIALVTIAP